MKKITLALAAVAACALIIPSSAQLATAETPTPEPTSEPTYGPQPHDQPMGRSWVSCPDHGVFYEAGWKPWIKDPSLLSDPYFKGWSPWGPTNWDPSTITLTVYPAEGWNLVCKDGKPKPFKAKHRPAKRHHVKPAPIHRSR